MDDAEDLYDDIFDQNKDQHYAEADINDLYENIHNPEVAETALDKVKGLTTENDKYKSQNSQLKSQISILNTINLELKTRNTHLEKNVKDLIETSRVEINRKNEQVRSLRAEMENVLFKRVARNINKRELEDLLKKHRPSEEPYSKLPTKPKLAVKKVEAAVVASPDLNTGNRQFVRKRKRISLEDNTVAKKARVEDNKENVVIKPGVKAEAGKGVDNNSNQAKHEKVDTKTALGSTLPNTTGTSKQDAPGNKESDSKSSVKPGHPAIKPKLENLDIGLISNYVKDKPRKIKKQVVETRKEFDPEPSKSDQVPNNVKSKVIDVVVEEKQVIELLEPVRQSPPDEKVSAAKTDASENSSSKKTASVEAKVESLPSSSLNKSKPRIYVPFDKLVKKGLSKRAQTASKSVNVAVPPSIPAAGVKASQTREVSKANVSKDSSLPIKLFNITSVPELKEHLVPKDVNRCDEAGKSAIKVKDPKSKLDKDKPSASSDMKTQIRDKSNNKSQAEVKVVSDLEPSIVKQVSKPEKPSTDPENNSSVTQSDTEASTSSKLKSPISKPNSVKTPQEWALGHQLFGSFDEKPRVKSRRKSRGTELEKKVVKDDATMKVVKEATIKVDSKEEASMEKTSATDILESPENYGSSRWNCEIHKLGFTTRLELRMHRSSASCFNKRESTSDTPKKRQPSGHPANNSEPETLRARVPSGDQKDFDFDCEAPKAHKEKKLMKETGKRKSKRPSRDDEEESGIIMIPVEICSNGGDEARLVRQSSITSEELNEAVRSITPTEDVLELGIMPADSFDDELDFEPEEEIKDKSVYFKNLDTKFSIPKVEKPAPVAEKTIKSTPAKSKAKERELEKKKDNKQRGRERSRSRNRNTKLNERPRRSSRSRRRKSRSLSRRRRSKSRNRSRSRNRNKSGKSPRKRSPSRERGRNNRRRSSRPRKRSESRTRCREPRSLSRNRSGERRKRPASRSRLEKLSRRSQSLSPARLRSKSPEIDLDNIDIEEEMSLDSLEKIKQKLMGEMHLDEDLKPLKAGPEDVEDGEITDTEDEEVQDILEKKGGADLRQKLLRKTRPNSKSGSDKENEVIKAKKSSKGARLQENIGIKACLKEYSAEDIENKLIPFKKRQFHELQFEELKIKKQIERARSKSSTPVRSVSESSASDCPHNNSQGSSTSYMLDNPMVDRRVSPPVKKSPAIRDRRVSRTNSRSDETKSPLVKNRNLSFGEQGESGQDSGSPSENVQKVSPIKLSLKGVVIERPSSSSSEAIAENVEVILEKVENSSQEERLRLQQDDNAVFPNICPATPPKPSKFSTDVSKDLFLTDDSDIEESPVKVFKEPSSYISPFRRPEGPLDLSSPKRAPLTPKTPLQAKAADMSSPQGISDMLRSPLVNNSILSPHTSNKLVTKVNFSQAVTSTPSTPLTTTSVSSNTRVPPTPSFLQSPTLKDPGAALKSSNPVGNPSLKAKKKRIKLGRSATSSNS